MSELSRTSSESAAGTEAEREALIEKLLLAGLDHYFEGSYEQAVNVWTRVAFLERGHGRARAYIERARGALAERQRQAEELLHRGVEAYEAGDLDTARELLMRAIADGGASDTALVFLQRLGRLQPPEVSSGVSASPGRPASHLPRFDPISRGRRPAVRPAPAGTRPSWLATGMVSAALVASILIGAQPIASWLGERPIMAPSAEPRPDEPLPIVRASEIQLARAREMYSKGQLRDALRVLEQINLADPVRAEADRLRADVQRDLLDAAPPASPRQVPADAASAPRGELVSPSEAGR
jgi:hypothetical protein